MKNIRILIVLAVFVAPLSVAPLSYGHGDEDHSVSSEEVVQDKAHIDDHREERINAAKEARQEKLSTIQAERLKDRCKAAQGKIASVSNRINGIETSRNEIYTNLLSRLNNLSEKLKEKSIDTSDLDAAITDLKSKIDSFNSSLSTYKQTIEDLQAMDCEADPDGFKATLELARSQLKSLKAESKSIHSFLKEEVKTILMTIKQQFENSESDQ